MKSAEVIQWSVATALCVLPAGQGRAAGDPGELAGIREHAVRIGTEGQLERILDTDGRSADPEAVLAPIFDGLSRYVADGKPRRVLVFVHGGLNSERSTVDRIARTSQQVEADGYYPIFISWDSRLPSAYLEHLIRIRQGERLESFFGYASSPVVLASDLVRAVGRAPLVWGTQLVNVNPTLRGWVVRQGDWRAAEDRLSDEFETLARDALAAPQGHGPAVAFERRSDERSPSTRIVQGGVRVLWAVPRLVSAPLIDAFGKSAWQVMRRRTQLMFQRDDGRGPGGLSRVLDRIRERLAGKGGRALDSGWEIAVVGHSMGTIVLNQILSQYGDLPFSDVVYMAAACSVDEYESSALPFLRAQREKGRRPRIYHLTLHPNAEKREGWWLPAPEGSLLVWIDDFLSTPLTQRDRTAGRLENLAPALERMPTDLREQVHLKRFGLALADGAPETHSGFSSDAFWCRELWEPRRDRALHADLPRPDLPSVASGTDPGVCASLRSP